MKTEIINALIAGKIVQVNAYSYSHQNHLVDLNLKNRDHYHFYAALFTDNEAYPFYRIKPDPVIIEYRSALLRNTENRYWVFTVNSQEKAADLENEPNFVKWITNWKSYGIVSD